MANIVIPGPSQLQVRWGCRRCGLDGLIAKTTIPVTAEWNEAMVRPLLDALRRKLARRHALWHGCIASPDDFTLERYQPVRGESLAGIV